MEQPVFMEFLRQENLIATVPTLAAAIRTTNGYKPAVAESMLRREDPLVQMYHIHGNSISQEAEMAASTVSGIAERLRRLASAYGEWDIFDAPAYFDLSVGQTAHLVKLTERVSTVYGLFFADLLLPSFQQAVAYWVREFQPIYQQLDQEPTLGPAFFQEIQPAMVAHWQRLVAVIEQTRIILSGDIGFWATNGAQEERERWRRWWRTPPAARLDPALLPALADVPTLTLSFEFPLPAFRQPDRLRRLRQNRARHLARKKRSKKSSNNEL